MKTTSLYICTKCDAQSPKWTGHCMECGSWGTVVDSATAPVPESATTAARSTARPAKVAPLSAATASGAVRIPTGIEETDRVLGGGIVPGSVTLIGGEPGIGKSTLSLMIAAKFSAQGKTAVYVSGEESAGQVRTRADRLGLKDVGSLFFLSETDVDVVIATLEKERPAIAIIDSVQMLRTEGLPSESGSANQLRAVTAKLVMFAKAADVPLVLVGHVTKDGNVAGPKTLEHLVDAVLSFEGERSGALRILRSLKNRFGSTDEAGIFAMEGDGLREVRNPSAYLLEDRQAGAQGDVISCVLEGSRPILVEIQALVRRTSFGYPTRRASGMDLSRLEMLIAVLAARGGIDLGEHDVFVNVVGGLRLKEPSADLAVVLALASAHGRVSVPADAVVWGEVGLGGEVRPANGTEKRLAEAKALGMKTVIAPLPKRATRPAGTPSVREARTVADALASLMTDAKASAKSR